MLPAQERKVPPQLASSKVLVPTTLKITAHGRQVPQSQSQLQIDDALKSDPITTGNNQLANINFYRFTPQRCLQFSLKNHILFSFLANQRPQGATATLINQYVLEDLDREKSR
ncbi:hypothetical protein V6N13_054691 [Hibiscus sabdariffa]